MAKLVVPKPTDKFESRFPCLGELKGAPFLFRAYSCDLVKEL